MPGVRIVAARQHRNGTEARIIEPIAPIEIRPCEQRSRPRITGALQHGAEERGAPRRRFRFDVRIASIPEIAQDFRSILFAWNFAHAEFGPRGLKPRRLIHVLPLRLCCRKI